MIRFDVVAGFLGAGKTTLLKKMLQTCAAGDEKVVIIENEFGEISIDAEILRVEGFDIYELSQGCVCCTLKKDFLLTLKNIIRQEPDRIIFEPSGIFMIAELFDLFLDPEISDKCLINSVTTVVDGQNFLSHRLKYPGFFQSQLSQASTVVISKSQLISPSQLQQIEEELRLSRPDLLLIRKNWADLSAGDLRMILDGNGLYNPLSKAGTGPVEGTHSHEHFHSLGIRTCRIFLQTELADILARLAGAEYGNILRGKGILQSAGGFLQFSLVDGHYQISPAQPAAEGIISLIGSGMDPHRLRAVFS